MVIIRRDPWEIQTPFRLSVLCGRCVSRATPEGSSSKKKTASFSYATFAMHGTCARLRSYEQSRNVSRKIIADETRGDKMSTTIIVFMHLCRARIGMRSVRDVRGHRFAEHNKELRGKTVLNKVSAIKYPISAINLGGHRGEHSVSYIFA